MKQGFVALLVFNFVWFLGCGKTSPITTTTNQNPVDASKAKETPAALPPAIETAIVTHKLYSYPELTVLLAVKDAQRTVEKVKAAGGKITYDPNLGQGHDIPFLIAELPPEKIVDKKFVEGLNLNAISVDHPSIRKVSLKNQPLLPSPEGDLYVPTEEIKIPELRKRGGNSRGKNSLVAIIDTGVDASHIAFGDRVVYWADLTREGRTLVQPAKLEDGKIVVKQKIRWDIPSRIDTNAPIYIGKFDEAGLGAQNSDKKKSEGDSGFDLNHNQMSDDTFWFIVGKAKNSKSQSDIVFIDVNGNEKLDPKEVEQPIIDFNEARSYTRYARSHRSPSPSRDDKVPGAALVHFPSRNKTRAYPLILERDHERNVVSATLGVDQIDHGTHVAGIVAGNDGSKVVGSAPEAELMSLKVCSGISCTDSAILRGLVEAFYNSQGLVPDVVNISLGSLEAYQQDPFNYLLRDLSAKFGTTFFLSASNDGPGYRAINSFGSFGPTVIVGANVSKKTLTQHYTLDPNQDVPEQSMFYFSSVGPSYTGQLRPNLVAPGSAISAVPMTQSRTAMLNGTSMSSPIAAGAAAALLALAKTPNAEGVISNEAFRNLEARREKKIKAVLNGSQEKSEYSNIDIPLALRTALESTARPMPEYTIAQTGHGLLDINRAYDAYEALVGKLNQKALAFLDFRLNDNKKGLYDRSRLQVPGSVPVVIGFEQDGEDIGQSYQLANETLTVQLESVEVQSSDGTVERLSAEKELDKLPFSIAIRGVEGKKGTVAQVVMNDGTKNSFYSLRHPELMSEGKTYLAKYTLSRKGQRLWTFLDVAHKALPLPNHPITVDLPALQVNKSDKVAAFAKRDVAIGANSFHRYPIAVTPQDGFLTVNVGLAQDERDPRVGGGFVYVTVYDPDSKDVAKDSCQRSYQLPLDKRTVKLIVPVQKKAGIYEVTIAAAGSRWNGPAKYDLLVEALRLRATKESIVLGLKESTQFAVSNGNNQAQELTVSLGEMSRMESLEEIPVIPNRWTYRRLTIPAMTEGGILPYTNIAIQFATGFDPNSGFSGRIDHRLYRRTKSGVFEEAFRGETKTDGSKHFSEIPRPNTESEEEPLYLAIETFQTVAESASLLKSVKTIDLEAIYKDVPVELDGNVSVFSAGVGGTNPFVYKVEAPAGIKNVKSHNPPKGVVRGILEVTADYPDVSFEIPVIIKQ